MKRINMLSKADMVKGQGVLSAHDEQVELAREVMENRAEILENAKGSSDITHYHSINPEYYLSTFRRRKQGALVGYVHFLPETVENSISLPRFAKNIFYKYKGKSGRKKVHLLYMKGYSSIIEEKAFFITLMKNIASNIKYRMLSN